MIFFLYFCFSTVSHSFIQLINIFLLIFYHFIRCIYVKIAKHCIIINCSHRCLTALILYVNFERKKVCNRNCAPHHLSFFSAGELKKFLTCPLILYYGLGQKHLQFCCFLFSLKIEKNTEVKVFSNIFTVLIYYVTAVIYTFLGEMYCSL